LVARSDDLFQLGTAFGLGVVAPVVALILQQVVREHRHWRILKNFFTQGFTANALLQQREGLHRVFPHHDFAINHRTIGQATDQAVEFRETFSQQLFPARPDPQAALALDQLCANAIKLPFHLPIGG